MSGADSSSGGAPRRQRATPHSRREWGWHRLDAEWAQRVVNHCPLAPGDVVLDIGAGSGALTAPLALAGMRVVAVELHDARAAHLRRRFAANAVTVVQVDVRRLRLPRRPFRVVASPPYSQTTDVLRLLLSTDRLLSADLVLQRAAARRMLAAPPSGAHARRYRMDLGMAVPRTAFSPPPRVDSVVLRIRRRVGAR